MSNNPRQELKRSDLTEPVFFDEKSTMNAAERFQHIVLRPVLKFQNALICPVAIDMCVSQDPGFKELSVRKRDSMLDKALTTNQPLRNLLSGMIIGMMDPEQLKEFLADRKDLSKRIQNMLRERIMDQYSKFL